MRLHVLAAFFLLYVSGSMSSYFDIWPSGFLRDAYIAYNSLSNQYYMERSPSRGNLLIPTSNNKSGVTIWDKNAILDGYTLYTSGHSQEAYLISSDGNLVHKWSLNYRDVWEPSDGVKEPAKDHLITFRKALMYPNGDLLIVYEGLGRTPWGHGLVKVDSKSQVLWKYMQPIHHSVYVGDDGLIYALDHHLLSNAQQYKGTIRAPFLDDGVVILDENGSFIKRISILDSIFGSSYESISTKFNFRDFGSGDYLHTNDVEVLTKDNEGKFSLGRAGDILVNLRNIDMMVLIDKDTEKVTWATGGSWRHPHDPDILDNGNILIFDNKGGYSTAGSRVLEFDPKDERIVWQFTGSSGNALYSSIRSAQQRLSNGSTLITESNNSRILEVDKMGNIVWEFYSPFRVESDDVLYTPVVMWASRYTAQQIDFEFNNGELSSL